MKDITDDEAQRLERLKAAFRTIIEDWPWFSAVWAFDYGDPAPLADLIRSQPIPDKLKNLVADIISGERPRNRRAIAKAKIPASQRANIFYRDILDRGLNKALRSLAMRMLESDTIRYKLIPIEPIELYQSRVFSLWKIPQELQELYGAGPDVLKAIRREGNRRLTEWPKG